MSRKINGLLWIVLTMGLLAGCSAWNTAASIPLPTALVLPTSTQENTPRPPDLALKSPTAAMASPTKLPVVPSETTTPVVKATYTLTPTLPATQTPLRSPTPVYEVPVVSGVRSCYDQPQMQKVLDGYLAERGLILDNLKDRVKTNPLHRGVFSMYGLNQYPWVYAHDGLILGGFNFSLEGRIWGQGDARIGGGAGDFAQCLIIYYYTKEDQWFLLPFVTGVKLQGKWAAMMMVETEYYDAANRAEFVDAMPMDSASFIDKLQTWKGRLVNFETILHFADTADLAKDWEWLGKKGGDVARLVYQNTYTGRFTQDPKRLGGGVLYYPANAAGKGGAAADPMMVLYNLDRQDVGLYTTRLRMLVKK